MRFCLSADYTIPFDLIFKYSVFTTLTIIKFTLPNFPSTLISSHLSAQLPVYQAFY